MMMTSRTPLSCAVTAAPFTSRHEAADTLTASGYQRFLLIVGRAGRGLAARPRGRRAFPDLLPAGPPQAFVAVSVSRVSPDGGRPSQPISTPPSWTWPRRGGPVPAAVGTAPPWPADPPGAAD